MNRIFKYHLADPIEIIEMPKGSKILDVQIQRGIICLWALVEESNELEKRKFIIHGTGERFDAYNQEYIGTVLLHDFVFHVFEVVK